VIQRTTPSLSQGGHLSGSLHRLWVFARRRSTCRIGEQLFEAADQASTNRPLSNSQSMGWARYHVVWKTEEGRGVCALRVSTDLESIRKIAHATSLKTQNRMKHTSSLPLANTGLGRPLPSSSCPRESDWPRDSAVVLGPGSPVSVADRMKDEETFRTVGVGDEADSDRSGDSGADECAMIAKVHRNER
jgi:hypothetical protein